MGWLRFWWWLNGRRRGAGQCVCGAILDATWHGYIHTLNGRAQHRAWQEQFYVALERMSKGR